MSDTAFNTLSQFEDNLWSAADSLRANSKLTSSEYCMPVLGIIFLRHATNRYETALGQIEADQTSGKMPKRPPIKADFLKRRAMLLPVEARYSTLLNLPKSASLGSALVTAMEAIERDFEPLRNQLPKDYGKFDPDLLEHLLRVFDSEALRTSSGDVFGRIYEYFLMKFAMQGAQDNGEFFTPPSLVQTIVNIIEPGQGIVFDPACGSGGMFVQSSHFIEEQGQDTAHRVTFYGQEKTATTIRLAKMNLAVHGLEGDIREANTFYEDVHPIFGNCDYVMANPPFNVDMVDAEKIKTDRRLPFGLPGVNKSKKVSNGNYLWISYFHSYLSPRGRAGFVMSSQASSAGHGEADVRRKLVETGDVDAMVAIRSNFFYTRTVPCELWFFDKAKPAARRDTVLMLDARNIYRKVTRKIYDFSPEQLKNLTAVVWLYRGEDRRFARLAYDYFEEAVRGAAVTHHAAYCWHTRCDGKKRLLRFVDALRHYTRKANLAEEIRSAEGTAPSCEALQQIVGQLDDQHADLLLLADKLYVDIEKFRTKMGARIFELDTASPKAIVHALVKDCPPLERQERQIAEFRSAVEAFNKLVRQGAGIAERSLGAKRTEAWRKTFEMPSALDDMQRDEERLRDAHHLLRTFLRHFHWLTQRFPNAAFRDVPGLCRAVTRAEIEAADWSLTPGRYVGVAPADEDEDFDFGQAIAEIHAELAGLNTEAAKLAATIQKNLEALGV